MSDQKIKIREALLSHGDAGAKAQVLELTERVLHRLDARKRLHEMMHREGSELVIGSRRHDLSRYRHVYAYSSGKAGNHLARAFEDLQGENLTLGVTIIKHRDEEDVYRKTEVYVGGHPLPNEEGIRGCQRMIDIAEQMGPDDLLLLGLGPYGHIGFNEPGEAFELETHCVDLTPATIEANKRFFDGNEDLVPKQAYTMGIKTIMQARKVLVVANGLAKAKAVKAVVSGPVTPECPGSILQMHPDCILVADEEALSLL